MQKKYKILILSNRVHEDANEDKFILDSFKKDGCDVKILWVDYDEKLDKEFDVIIRRNTWVEESDEILKYQYFNDKLKSRLINKNIKTVNLIGLDGMGKKYLVDLYKNKERVIPSYDNVVDALKEDLSNKYILKEMNSFGSGLGQRVVSKEDLMTQFKIGDLIQPKISFQSEVQCYFVGDKLMYSFEFIPSKYPDYPTPKKIELTASEKILAKHFASYSNLKVGFQRIDFLRQNNNELILLEIEDNSPYMDLKELDSKTRHDVINEYKRLVYEFIERNM